MRFGFQRLEVARMLEWLESEIPNSVILDDFTNEHFQNKIIKMN